MKRTITILMLLLMAGAAMSQGTFTCGEQVTDGDGNSYETVKIGGICWTKSNMKSKTYSDGTPVAKAMVYSSSMYPDTNANLATYGRLYTWFSAVNVPEGSNIKPTRNADGFVQGICPEGWHIPTVGDMDRLNANSAESLRSVELWLQPNNNTNSTGFSSLPAGYYTLASNRFEALLGYTYYWSDSSTTPAFAIACDVNYFCDVAENKQKTTGDGVSVRCVKDCSLPTVITAAESNITDATADCGGEVIDDGGTTVTARGVCWSTSPNPTIDSAHTSDGNGMGSFTSNITGLTAGTTYYVRAYAINSVDTAYGNEVSFTTIVIDEKSCPEAQTVTDIESNVYATVKIGNQCWMRDNLRTTMYADSTAIAAGNDTSSTVPYYYDYNESGIKWKDRGYLYNWAAVMNGADTSNAVPSGVQGICPEGWHVPSDAEWTIMEQTQTNMDVTGTGWRGDHAGKLAGEGWSSSTTTAGAPGNAFDTAHNTSGFSAVPAGNFNGSSFDYADNYAFFWSSTQCNSNSAWHRSMYSGYAFVCRYDYVKNYGFSVRCLRDEDVVIDEKSCPEAQTVTDIESNVYATVKIGNQCWMRENLRTTMYADSTVIAAGGSTTSETYPYYYDYNESGIDLKVRGYLYNWAAVMNGADTSNAVPSGVQGICPKGWHVPSDAEWTQLTDYVRSIPEYYCDNNSNNIAKALADSRGWNSSENPCAVGDDQGTNNATGFSAVPAGWMSPNSLYDLGGSCAYFWSTATTSHSEDVRCREVCYFFTNMNMNYTSKDCGYSVRCLKDEDVVIDEKSCPEAKTVTDHEGNLYATVKIGNQCWMRQNLRTTTSPSTGTYLVTTNDTATYTGKQARWFDNDSAQYAPQNYGLLYNWNAAVDTFNTAPQFGELSVNRTDSNAVSVTFTGHRRGICPEGWHLPSDAEWDTLTNYVNSKSEYICDYYSENIAKALADTTGWNQNQLFDICAPGNPQYTNNATGFSAVPAGYCGGSGFNGAGGTARFWSSSQYGSYNAWYRDLDYEFASVDRFYHGKNYGRSVRCVKDNDAVIDEKSCPEAQTVTDIESNVYATVKIGNQCWMRENLRTTMYADSTVIAAGGSTTSETYPYYYDYNESGIDLKVRGYLYNWAAVMNGADTSNAVPSGVQGICPKGWHVPSDAEWTQLTDYVRSIPEYKCDNNTTNIAKALADSRGWNSSENPCAVGDDQGTNNATGFSAVPAGWMSPNSLYDQGGSCAYFWSTATTSLSEDVRCREVCCAFTNMNGNFTSKDCGYSVRCLKDEDVVIDEKSCPEAKTVTDHENNVYATVKIGNQCWMRDNLRTTTSPSTGTYLVTTNDTATYTGKQARWYNNAPATFAPLKYGLLYNWNAAVDTFNTAPQFGELSVNRTDSNAVSVTFTGHRRGICPEGWHLPSDAEWMQLTDYVGSQNEYICYNDTDYVAKALADSTGWGPYSGECTPGDQSVTANNATGFSAVPAGYRHDLFYSACESAYFWSSTQYNRNRVWYRELIYEYASVSRSNIAIKSCGFSVRCVKDNDAVIDEKSCPEAKTVTDVDNNAYATVKIGDQCWMRENLRTTKYADGRSIAAGGNTPSDTTRYYYDNNSSNIPLEQRGYLYNWVAAMDSANSSNANPSGVQGICPTGWHLPSDAEWNLMEKFVSGSDTMNVNFNATGYRGSHAGKLAGGDKWTSVSSGNVPGNMSYAERNAFGFSAVPAGFCNGSWFMWAGFNAYFWSSTQDGIGYAWGRDLNFGLASVFRDYRNESDGLSVRCVKNENGSSTAALPTVSTNTVSNIADTSATCGGEVTDEGGANVTARGVCWSTSPNPTIADSHTIDDSGTGSFTSNITGLTVGTTYYARAYATNSKGTAYGNEVSFTTVVIDEKSCREAKTVTDHEGNGYATVKIGNQCWTRQNLRTTTSPSTGTYLVTTDYDYTYTGKQARWYDNDSAQYAPQNYGLLYNWNAAVDTFTAPQFGETSVNFDENNAVSVTFTGHRRGICPEGWHLPSDAEWDTLTTYVSSQSEYICDYSSGDIAKALADTTGWNQGPEICAPGNQQLYPNNATGFSAVPVGWLDGAGFYSASERAIFWSSTQYNRNRVWYRELIYNYASVSRSNGAIKFFGSSVRCVKDNDAVIDEKSCPEAKTVTDVDNNAYATVKIGNQCWMRENLRTTKYANGVAIDAGGGSTSTSTPYYYDYTASNIDLKDRGLLYNWPAVMNGDTSSNAAPSGVQGVCPTGWHLPSDAEWNIMEKFVSGSDTMNVNFNATNSRGSHAGKLAGGDKWSYSLIANAPGNTNYTERNASGFSAVPAGNCDGLSFGGAGAIASFWSSTQDDSNYAWYRDFHFGDASVFRYYDSKGVGLSVRCVKD